MVASMTWPQFLRSECCHDGKIVKLTPGETNILSVLLIHHPRPVSMGRLVPMVYPDPDKEPDFADDSIKVLVYRLRKKLPGLIGWRRGYGYSLTQR